MTTNETSSGKTDGAGAGPGMAVAVAALAAAAALLVFTVTRPPQTLCEPVVGLPTIAFALAQALAVVALGAIRRKAASSLLPVTLALAWAMLAGAVLLLRQSAGDVDAMRRDDILLGVAGGIGLFLMFHGMAMRLEKSRAGGWVVVTLIAAVIALGYAKVMDDAPPQRMFQSWDAVNRLNDAIVVFRQKNGTSPTSAGGIEGVISQLEPTYGTSLPRLDGWDRELDYVSDGKTYEIASRGAFGERGPNSIGAVRAYADDIVTQDGLGVSWPERPCGATEEEKPLEAAPASGPTGPPAPPVELPAPPGTIDTRHRRAP